MLNTEFKKENGELLVILEGSLDTLTAGDFDKKLTEALSDDVQRIIMDVKDVQYISSAGLRTILAAQQRMEDDDLDGVLVINANEIVRDIFSVTGFDKLVDME